MKNRNYSFSRRRKSLRKKEPETCFNTDIKFICSKCNFELLFWFDGIEHEISGLKCENCGETHTLSDFFIEHEEEIKKELVTIYGNTPGEAPLNPQEEFDRRLFEAGFIRDKPVFEENMTLRGEKYLIN